jgi:hypothetical protein
VIVLDERDPRWRSATAAEDGTGQVRAPDGARDRGRRIAALVRSVFATAAARGRGARQ